MCMAGMIQQDILFFPELCSPSELTLYLFANLLLTVLYAVSLFTCMHITLLDYTLNKGKDHIFLSLHP